MEGVSGRHGRRQQVGRWLGYLLSIGKSCSLGLLFSCGPLLGRFWRNPLEANCDLGNFARRCCGCWLWHIRTVLWRQSGCRTLVNYESTHDDSPRVAYDDPRTNDHKPASCHTCENNGAGGDHACHASNNPAFAVALLREVRSRILNLRHEYECGRSGS